LRALCDPAVHFGNEIFKDGNKLVVGHQPGHFDVDPAVIEHELAAIGCCCHVLQSAVPFGRRGPQSEPGWPIVGGLTQG
jgi:hypothetical protein